VLHIFEVMTLHVLHWTLPLSTCFHIELQQKGHVERVAHNKHKFKEIYYTCIFDNRLFESGVGMAETGRVLLRETKQGGGNDRQLSWAPKIRDLRGNSQLA
jgi:hypothetical protein